MKAIYGNLIWVVLETDATGLVIGALGPRRESWHVDYGDPDLLLDPTDDDLAELEARSQVD